MALAQGQVNSPLSNQFQDPMDVYGPGIQVNAFDNVGYNPTGNASGSNGGLNVTLGPGAFPTQPKYYPTTGGSIDRAGNVSNIGTPQYTTGPSSHPSPTSPAGMAAFDQYGIGASAAANYLNNQYNISQNATNQVQSYLTGAANIYAPVPYLSGTVNGKPSNVSFNGPYLATQSNMVGQTFLRPSNGVSAPGNPLLAYPYDLNQNASLGQSYLSGQTTAQQYFAGVSSANVQRDVGLLGGVFQSGTNPYETTSFNNVFSNLFRSATVNVRIR